MSTTTTTTAELDALAGLTTAALQSTRTATPYVSASDALSRHMYRHRDADMSYMYECRGRCPSCTGNRLVQSDGPVPCDVMLIGDAPGFDDDNGGRPFSGKAGKELNENLIFRMGLARSAVYFTNSVKCRGEKGKKPTDNLRTTCATHFIAEEVRIVKPKVIILFGAQACGILNIDIDLEKDHGYPIKITASQAGLLGDFDGYVIPMYHPTSGMHNTAMLTPLLEDADNIREWLHERWEPPTDISTERDYRIVDKPGMLTLLVDTPALPLSIDTESASDRSLYSIQWSQFPGTGYAIFTVDEAAIRAFIEFINDTAMDIIAQNAVHDYKELYKLGAKINPFRLQDTMQRAFQLGNLPQGLKAMSSRLNGVRMESFASIVVPPSLDILGYWYDLAQALADSIAPKRRRQYGAIDPVAMRTMDAEEYLASLRFTEESLPTPLTKELARTRKSEKDQFKKAAKLYAKYDLASTGLPSPPQPGIEYVADDIARWYMCQDPDITLRAFLRIRDIIDTDKIAHGIPLDPWRQAGTPYVP